MPQLTDYLGTPQIQWILILIGIDVILGILAAIVKKDFRFGKLAQFMQLPVVGYIFGFAVLEMAFQALPQLSFALPVAFVLVLIALIASILRNLAKLGLPLPGLNRM